MNPYASLSDRLHCYLFLGAIGYWVNGVSIFGASDGTSYQNQGVWLSSALAFEVYDLDICGGHAANGEYHHHQTPYCIQEMLQDDGTAGHSSIYGWMLDGYPVYGPYQATDLTATSCWKTREYTTSSATGCGASNSRTCVLTDPYDLTQGTTSATAGPLTTATVTSQSGNPIEVVSGAYVQDYYYDSSCTGSDAGALDAHNGHSHGDLGYHYHVTATYPFVGGPKYYGCRSGGACCTTLDDRQCNGLSVCGTADGVSSPGCSTGTRPNTTNAQVDSSSDDDDDVCFHVDSKIDYKGVEYTYEELKAGKEPECTVPHSPFSKGVVITTSCDKTVRVTDTHLMATTKGFQLAYSLKAGDVLFGDYNKDMCIVQSVEKEPITQQYFGLNCVHSEVLASGLRASTFGDFHTLPSWYMTYVGGLMGSDKASLFGKYIADWYYYQQKYIYTPPPGLKICDTIPVAIYMARCNIQPCLKDFLNDICVL